LWKEILESKYGSWRSLDQDSSNKKESRLWRDLRSICEENNEGKLLMIILHGELEEVIKYCFGMIVGKQIGHLEMHSLEFVLILLKRV